jgi:hypothetical protein
MASGKQFKTRQLRSLVKMRGFHFYQGYSTMIRSPHPGVLVLALCSLPGLCASSQADQGAALKPAARAEAVVQARNHSCRELAARSTQYGDGRYWLQLQDQSVLLYCHDMAGTPREYLDLPEGNCSEYVTLRPNGIRRVQTCFQRVRLDPGTLRVDIGDLTFSQTRKQGVVRHDNKVVDAMPYATAMSCDAPGLPVGKAHVTLTGTGFAAVDTFKAQGYMATGEVKDDGSGQSLELRGGGYCGWIAPGDVYGPYYASGWNPLEQGGFLLQLRTLADDASGDAGASPISDSVATPRCYWMENQSGQYQWIPADALYGKVLAKDECFALDSCDGGGGRSGGGCYKWATEPLGERIGWGKSGTGALWQPKAPQR